MTTAVRLFAIPGLHWPALLALASSAGFIAACKGDGPPLAQNRCVADWPAPAPFEPQPALDTGAPEILWTARITGSSVRDSLLVTDDRVAFTAGRRLYLLDKQGNYLGRRASAALELITSAASDEDGNFYFVGHSVYAVDRNGEFLWVTPLPGEDGRYPRARGRVALDPSGGLFFGADDGYLYAVERKDGSLRWRTRVAGDGERSPNVIAGVSAAVLAVAPDGSAKPQLWDTTTGEPMAHFEGPRGNRFGVLFGRSMGIITQRMEDRGGAYPWMHISALDECSRERWHLSATRPQWPVLLGPDDQLFVAERDDVENSPTFVSVYDPDGKRVRGPTQMPLPWGVGADGTIYALACDSSGYDGPSRLYGYSPDLQEQWMLPLGDSCPTAGPVIDDEGRLYFAWYRDRATEIVAVQTASPGLAEVSWPTRQRDRRGAGWLAPVRE